MPRHRENVAKNMAELPAITQFILARIVEDETDLALDDRHWSEAGPLSNARLMDERNSKRELIRGLTLMVNIEWSGSYAVRDVGRGMFESMAAIYSDHPDYRNDWWEDAKSDAE